MQESEISETLIISDIINIGCKTEREEVFHFKEDLSNCSKEEIINFKSIIEDQQITINYSNYQRTAIQLRGSVIEWLYLINFKLQKDEENLFKAILLFDHYLEKTNIEMPREKIQLYAAVFYYIACKLEEVQMFNGEFLRKEILKENFSANEINFTEMEILKKLNFKLQSKTIHKYSEYFIEAIEKILDKVSRGVEKMNTAKLFRKLNYFVKIMSLCVNEIIFCLKPFYLAFINIKTTLLFLVDQKIISEEIYFLLDSDLGKIVQQIDSAIDIEEINITSDSLYETINYQIRNSKSKAFFQIYYDCFLV